MSKNIVENRNFLYNLCIDLHKEYKLRLTFDSTDFKCYRIFKRMHDNDTRELVYIIKINNNLISVLDYFNGQITDINKDELRDLIIHNHG